MTSTSQTESATQRQMTSASGPAELLAGLQQEVGQSVFGFEPWVRQLMLALVTEGHVLLEGVPGLAKTYFVRTLASSLSLSFKRIQFTPDMLPSDITGAVVLDPKDGQFVYRPGPLFANLVLADEINRAPPKVQSALLEAMQERQVTVDGVAHPLPRPFLVIATQNPIEQEGTYPLPEAEMDRVLFRLLLDYPTEPTERALVACHAERDETVPARRPIDPGLWAELHRQALAVTMAPEVLGYLVGLVRRTRGEPRVLLGASPRAAVQLARAAKAAALFAGRSFVTPEDVQSVAFDVLNHRLLLHPDVVAQEFAEGRVGLTGALRAILGELLRETTVPR